MTLLLYALAGGKVGIVSTLSATSPVLILPLLWLRTGQRPAPGAWAGRGAGGGGDGADLPALTNRDRAVLDLRFAQVPPAGVFAARRWRGLGPPEMSGISAGRACRGGGGGAR